MRSHVRITLFSLVVGALVALTAPAAAQAAFGVESFFAANCKVNTCKKVPPAEEKEKAEAEGYTQAAGHPPFGITDFTLNREGEKPQGVVTHIRTDVAPGVSTNPQAVPKCSMEEFGTKEVAPESGAYPASTCKPETKIGINKVVVYVEAIKKDVPLEGTVYNLEQPTGRSSLFGVAISLAPLGSPFFAHTLIEGNVEWGKEAKGTNQGDYHDYFEIHVSPALPLVSSRLIFEGNIGTGGFLTNPTSCTGTGPQTTTTLKLESKEAGSTEAKYTTPIGIENCGAVPFAPGFSLSPETTQSDLPDGISALLTLPHNPNPAELDSSDVKEAKVVLPEGMTLNPSAAHGLEACTETQSRIHTSELGFGCPGGSKIGTVALNVPGLPEGSLTGNVYLGGPASGPITAAPYTIYVDAESARYGIAVRLKGLVKPNETTGQITTTFSENPEQPFSNLTLTFTGGALAPIANPLACGTAKTETALTPFTATAAKSPASAFTVDSNNKGGSCPSPLPFAPAQGTAVLPATGGAHSAFTFNLERPSDGNQYLTKVRTVLPSGLIGLIPTVEQCGEAQANSGTCPAGSQLGTVTALAGSGPTPFPFSGKVYLTGPYKGAPFGMSIVVPNVAGPFNLGLSITRATISVEPISGRVVVTSEIPTIVYGGIPVRLRRVGVSINRPGFLVNPTNCGVLATESTVIGSFGASQPLSTPFQVEKCSSLAFKPSFKAATAAKATKANGASLETTLNLPAGGANVKSVLVSLPIALPSRLTTLQKACPEATFAANPLSCPPGSFVGGARANTPALKDKLKGPAILVSHGGAAFPDLDLVLEADGVRVILVGNTDIKKGITTTNFATTPDDPVSSITVNLPTGPHSALAAFGNLCTIPLTMPTTITGQNGVVLKQKTKITTKGCGVQIIGHKVVGNSAYVTVKTFSAGRISGRGPGLSSVFRHLRGAANATRLKVSLARGVHGPRRVRLRVGFLPSNRRLGSSASFITLNFR
jgi:hypothetical protein